jgi:hypothetical protein
MPLAPVHRQGLLKAPDIRLEVERQLIHLLPGNL